VHSASTTGGPHRRLPVDEWPDDAADEAASAALALGERALLLTRVSGGLTHLAHAKCAVCALLAEPPQALDEESS